MSLDGFLTVLTIVIAAYTVMPTVTRLRIALRRGWLALISIVALLLILYLEFFALLGRPCSQALGEWCKLLTLSEKGPITPQHVAFLVAMLWLVLASITLARTKLSPRSLPALSRLVSELAYQQHYSDLVELTDPQLLLLNTAASRNLRWARLHDCLAALDPDKASIRQLLAALRAGEKPQSERSVVVRARAFMALCASKLAGIVPSQRRAEEAAQDILRLMFRTPAITEFIATYRPSFGVRLLSLTTTGVHDFSDTFLTAMMSAPQSILYSEIKDNQNLAHCGYAYPAHNELLHLLFADAKTAKRLSVWKPVGEYVIAALRKNQHPDYAAFLNGRAEFFQESERWKDKTFVALRFFDLMVTAARASRGICGSTITDTSCRASWRSMTPLGRRSTKPMSGLPGHRT